MSCQLNLLTIWVISIMWDDVQCRDSVVWSSSNLTSVEKSFNRIVKVREGAEGNSCDAKELIVCGAVISRNSFMQIFLPMFFPPVHEVLSMMVHDPLK